MCFELGRTRGFFSTPGLNPGRCDTRVDPEDRTRVGWLPLRRLATEPKARSRRIARTRKSPDINATLIDAALREDAENVKYYKLEFRVESPSFRRHNVAVCCARNGKLYTMNAQAPESAWKNVQKEFAAMADSFNLVVDA